MAVRATAKPGRIRHGLELHRGRAEPIATTTEVSGSREGGVSSTVTTTFELDGCVVQFSGLVPFRNGDEAVVAGRRDGCGILQAYAVQLPRQDVLLGSSTGYWAGGAIVLAIGFLILLIAGPDFYARAIVGNGAESNLLDASLPGLAGLFLAMVGVGLIWRGMVVDHARALVTRPGRRSKEAGDRGGLERASGAGDQGRAYP